MNCKIKNSVAYLPTILNGFQVVTEFDWNLKFDSSLNNKGFMSQARETLDKCLFDFFMTVLF